VTLFSREANDFIASKCFMAPENEKIFQVLQAGNNFLQYASKLQEKN
jgi:hypothetical protein